MTSAALPTTIDYPHGITAIDTLQHRPLMACCYLIESGGRHALVECGTSLSVAGVLAVLAQRGIALDSVDYVMPTHVHLDHAGGAGLLMRELPNAKLLVHPRGARHLIDPRKLIEGATAVYGADVVAATYGEILPVAESRVVIAEDGLIIEFGGRQLQVLDAPGHARHHYALWDQTSQGWFTGDVFGLSYREFDGPRGAFLIATTTPVQFEPEAWQQTLDRMMARKPQVAYLTHYGAVYNLDYLATELRGGIETYALLARLHAKADQRHAVLLNAITAYELGRVTAHECPVTLEEAQALLAIDLELNVQGLEVWADKLSA